MLQCRRRACARAHACGEPVLHGRMCAQFTQGKDPSTLSVKEVVANFARNNERRMAQKVRAAMHPLRASVQCSWPVPAPAVRPTAPPPLQMVEQRRKLPPMVNDRALFTRAAPFNDKSDPFYHSPSSRIGNNYSPSSMHASAILFEQFPQASDGLLRATATTQHWQQGTRTLSCTRSSSHHHNHNPLVSCRRTPTPRARAAWASCWVRSSPCTPPASRSAPGPPSFLPPPRRCTSPGRMLHLPTALLQGADATCTALAAYRHVFRATDFLPPLHACLALQGPLGRGACVRQQAQLTGLAGA